MRIFFLFSIILTIGLFSCEKPQEYDKTPKITFSSIDIKDGAEVPESDGFLDDYFVVSVKFSFIDGDGDLGLDPWDTLGDYSPDKNYYNLLFDFYTKDHQNFTHKENYKQYFRFQNISKENTNNKVIKGDMITELYFIKDSVKADTAKLLFYIYDRALNKSNIEETPEITFHE